MLKYKQNMTKKDYLIKFLQLLEKKRPSARGLLELIKRSNLNDSIFDHIIDTINQEINTINIAIWSNNLSKTIHMIQKIRGKENIEKEQEQLELAELEEQLNYT